MKTSRTNHGMLESLRERFATAALAGMVALTCTQCNVAMDGLSDEASNSSSSSSSGSSSSASATGSVSGTNGTLKSADGSPIAGAAVVLSRESSSGSMSLGRAGSRGVLGLTNDNGQYIPLFSMTDDEGESCDDIADGIAGDIIASDCTDVEGLYSLSAEDIPCGTELTFTAKKGSFTLSVAITLACAEDEDELVVLDDIEFDDDCGIEDEIEAAARVASARYSVDDESCVFDAARMAVVTGYYDEIQNVLAKLGFGATDESGRLDTSEPFDFTLVDGDGTLDESYSDFEDFVSDPETMSEYDIVFINCGNAQELLALDETIRANIQEYVAEGGKLYVTDWSYGFIEQPFPSFMNFLDGGEDAETPETHAAAKQGTGGISVDADVKDPTLASWLDEVAVNDGTIEEDCFLADPDRVNARNGARNDDGTVTIADFLGAWVVMTGEHEGFEGETQTWIKGVVSADPGVANAPLTVTRDHGEGRLLYSSYHTAHSCPTLGFWPQERILQYLVFDL